jgi:hypothetical protein
VFFNLEQRPSNSYEVFCETLRKVECLGKWEQGFLPSSSCVQEKANQMYQRGQVECPITHVNSALGEMYQFEYEQMLGLILKLLGSMRLHRRSPLKFASHSMALSCVITLII